MQKYGQGLCDSYEIWHYSKLVLFLIKKTLIPMRYDTSQN